MEPEIQKSLGKRDWVIGLVMGTVYYLVTIGFYALVARLAPTPHDFGVFVSALSLLNATMLFMGLGLDAAMFSKGYRYYVRHQFDLLRGLFRSLATWTGFVMLVLAGAAAMHFILRENVYHLPPDIDALVLTGWAAAACALEFGCVAFLNACGRPLLGTFLDKGLQGLFRLGFGLGILYLFRPAHVIWALGGIVIAELIVACIAFVVARRSMMNLDHTKGARITIKEWMAGGLINQFTFLATIGVSPLFILVARLDRQDLFVVGAFGALFETAKIILVPFSGMRFLSAHVMDQLVLDRDIAGIKKEVKHLVCGAMGATGVFALVAVVAGPYILELFGPAFAIYDYELAIVGIGLGVTESARALGYVPMYEGKTRLVLLSGLGCLAIGLAITAFFSYRDDIFGMAFGFFSFAVLQIICNYIIVQRIFNGWRQEAKKRAVLIE